MPRDLALNFGEYPSNSFGSEETLTYPTQNRGSEHWQRGRAIGYTPLDYLLRKRSPLGGRRESVRGGRGPLAISYLALTLTLHR